MGSLHWKATLESPNRGDGQKGVDLKIYCVHITVRDLDECETANCRPD